MTQTTIGDLLRRYRLQPTFIEKDTLTQKELADFIGYHNSVVSRVERGDQLPTLEYLQRFIEVMNLPVEEAKKIWGIYRPDTLAVPTPLTTPIREDWGEALDVVFYGRQAELDLLQEWLLTDHCRLVAVLGLGGIGKTALVTTLARQLKGEFEFILWRSLRNAPPIADLLAEAIKFFSNQQQTDLPADVSKRITLLLDYFRQHRCLLVLDNLETILQSGRAGYYIDDYEGYGELIQRMGHTDHQSCLLLTSREKPKELASARSKTTPVQLLQLDGLNPAEGCEILEDLGLSGSEEDLITIIQRYAGIPLALKLVSGTIQTLYSDDIATFLKDTTTAVGYVRDPLEQQFERLSALEKEVMYWLAIERESVSLQELIEDIVRLESPQALLKAVEDLQSRSMIETSSGRFTLHQVVMEYITDQLIQNVYEEIVSKINILLQSHTLIKATAKDYLRESQIKFILKPVANKLLTTLSKEAVETHLHETLLMLKKTQPHRLGYAGGNIINLLCYFGSDLRGFDFSELRVRQAYLQDVVLQDVSFIGADLTKCVFMNTFGIILSVAFSRNRNLLAVGTINGEIYLWRVTDGEQVLSFKGHTEWTCVAFNPQGDLLASCSTDQTVKLWETDTGRLLKVMEHSDPIWSVVFSPNGHILATGSNNQTVKLWEVNSGQCLKTLRGTAPYVNSVAFSPDGQLLASSSYEVVELWDISTSQCYRTWKAHADEVQSVAFGPSGRILATGSWDHTIKLWDVGTGQLLKILQEYTDAIETVTFSVNGLILASSSDDWTVKLWEVSTGQLIRTLQGHSNWVRSVAIDSDSSIVISGGDDQTIRLWNIKDGRLLRTLRGFTNHIRSIAFSPDGNILASGSEDQIVRLWDISNEHFIALRSHSGWIRSVIFSPDGHILASASDDATLKLWDISTGQLLKTLECEVRSVAFSPDGSVIACGGYDQVVKLWDVSTGECFRQMEGHEDSVFAVGFSPNGKLIASGGYDRTVKLWNVSTGKLLRTLNGHTNRVRSVAFSPDGHLLASGSVDQTVKIWDVKTGQVLNSLQGHTGWIKSVTFSPDGSILASGSDDRTVKLWEVQTGLLLKTLQGHTRKVRTVAFSPNGSILASAGSDEIIKFWDIRSGECFKTLRPDRPYERMNITGVTGLTEAQKASLKALGAIDLNDPMTADH